MAKYSFWTRKIDSGPVCDSWTSEICKIKPSKDRIGSFSSIAMNLDGVFSWKEKGSKGDVWKSHIFSAFRNPIHRPTFFHGLGKLIPSLILFQTVTCFIAFWDNCLSKWIQKLFQYSAENSAEYCCYENYKGVY